MAVHIGLPILQAAVIIAVGCSPIVHDWTFWVILAVLMLACLYFSFMLFYKLYRARLTFVTFTKENVSYYTAFKKAELQADEIDVKLCDYGKPDGKTKYAIVCDKNDPDNGFMLAVSTTKSLAKYKDCVPEQLLRFIIACTTPAVLKTERETAADGLKELIDLDLEERDQTKKREEEETRKMRKRKKK